MLVRLTTERRKKAGWILTLVYMLCIMAPTLSYALPGEHAPVPCMTEAVMVNSAHIHDAAVHPMGTHVDGQPHDYSPSHGMAMSDEDDTSSMLTAADGDEAPLKTSPYRTSGKCCATMCVSATPASLLDIAMPPMPGAIRITTTYRAVAEKSPAVHDRPPIA